MATTKKKANPYTKNNRINLRLGNEEMQLVHTKAVMFSGGVISEFVREAVLKYKPIKKVVK